MKKSLLVLIALFPFFIPGQVRIHSGWITSFLLYGIIYVIIGYYEKYGVAKLPYYKWLIIAGFILLPIITYINTREFWYPTIMPAYMFIGGISFFAGYAFQERRVKSSAILLVLVASLTWGVIRNINYLIFFTSVNPTSYINLIGSRPKLSFLNLEDPSFKPDWRGKILIIDFWFLECQSCQAKSKTFEELSATYKNRKDIVFLSVINGKINSKEKALQYLKTHKSAVPVLYDEEGKFEERYDIGKLGFPVEIRINKEGRINGVIEGFYDGEVYYAESFKSINKAL